MARFIMENKKSPLPGIVVSAVIITGAIFCFWFYRVVISEPHQEINKTTVLKIKTEIYNKIVSDDSSKADLPLTDENFGRTDPFVKY